jgi:adenylate cyclase
MKRHADLMEPAPASEHPPTIRLDDKSPVAMAAAELLAAGRATLRFYEPLALAGDMEGVHQFRVTVRRLRAAVEVLAPVLHGSRAHYYRRELPVVGHSAGAVRDCDVMSELLRAHSAVLDPAGARALTPALQALADYRVSALRDLGRFVASRRFTAEVTVRTLAPMMLRPIIRAARSSGGRLKLDSPPEAFHRLRVRLKRLRYGFELLEQLSGKRTAKALKRLRRLQDELGEHQDLVNTASWLRQFATRAVASPETLLATGALIQSTVERRAKVAARAFKRWQKLASGTTLGGAQAEIASFARAPASDPPETISER